MSRRTTSHVKGAQQVSSQGKILSKLGLRTLTPAKRALLALSLAMCAIGFIAWMYQLDHGLAVTGMRNSFTWGLYIAIFAFMVGAAAGGMIVSSSIYLFKLDVLKPFARIASLSAFACILGAGLMIILDLGSINHIVNILTSANFRSPLVWDICVITGYLIITALSVIFQMLPSWKRRGIFGSAVIQVWSEQKTVDFSATWSRRVALVGLPFAVLIHTVTALIFATQAAREWWHTAILPPDFIAMAVASGSALVLMVCMVASGKQRLEDHRLAFALMARMVAGALTVHFFFTAIELLMNIWTGSAETTELMHLLFVEYGPFYSSELVLPLIALMMFFNKRIVQKRAGLFIGSILVIVGAFVHRMMLLYPGFNMFPLSLNVPAAAQDAWTVPIAIGEIQPDGSVFTSFWHYLPTSVEYCVVLLPLGLTLFILLYANTAYNPKRDT
ncbi:MAG: polysulfide reductase NrfD [Coriobacteriales bacterium]|jgi:molybdopterin-containing oxidoreductase family membrane subunit|nr:polysulfide reductase NrfD [Coriobacteriales bacterium]